MCCHMGRAALCLSVLFFTENALTSEKGHPETIDSRIAGGQGTLPWLSTTIVDQEGPINQLGLPH